MSSQVRAGIGCPACPGCSVQANVLYCQVGFKLSCISCLWFLWPSFAFVCKLGLFASSNDLDRLQEKCMEHLLIGGAFVHVQNNCMIVVA